MVTPATSTLATAAVGGVSGIVTVTTAGAGGLGAGSSWAIGAKRLRVGVDRRVDVVARHGDF